MPSHDALDCSQLSLLGNSSDGDDNVPGKTTDLSVRVTSVSQSQTLLHGRSIFHVTQLIQTKGTIHFRTLTPNGKRWMKIQP